LVGIHLFKQCPALLPAQHKAETPEAERDVFGTDGLYNKQSDLLLTKSRFQHLQYFTNIDIAGSLYDAKPPFDAIVRRRHNLGLNDIARKGLNITVKYRGGIAITPGRPYESPTVAQFDSSTKSVKHPTQYVRQS
jgi:hypothetical protein